MSDAPGPVVIGFDGSDSGEDAIALGRRLAQAMEARPLVMCVYEDEAPISVARVDAEWVAYGREHAQGVLDGAAGSPATTPSIARSARARPRTGSTTAPTPRAQA